MAMTFVVTNRCYTTDDSHTLNSSGASHRVPDFEYLCSPPALPTDPYRCGRKNILSNFFWIHYL